MLWPDVFIGILFGVLISFLIFRNLYLYRRISYIEMDARARAETIENEAKQFLNETKLSLKELEMEQEKNYQTNLLRIKEGRNRLSEREKTLEEREAKILLGENRLLEKEKKVDQLEEKKMEILEQYKEKLELISSMNVEEAREYIIEIAKQKNRVKIAKMSRDAMQFAKDDIDRKAKYILAQATTRYAGEFAGERLISKVNLPSDEHKGMVIGKDGRNIKALESLLGVDIIIDETPGVIMISSFNLYRRAIAIKVVEMLIEDGRVHPARIEEAYEKVVKEFEEETYNDGRDVLADLGIYPMSEKLTRLLGKLKYRASYGQNALAHTLEVARLAGVMAAEIGGDEKLAVRAGLLHDIGKALTQEYGGSHVDIGVDLCQKNKEHPTVINAILAHHGHAEPDSIESACVCSADVLSAARPGARREVLEAFAKRVKELEDIATSKESVEYAYAINAGREIRVIVNAKKISDDEATVLSQEIAQEIEEKVQYPAEIKVNVIRETRSISYAK
ncbi:MAG: ribonuclease Y [Campylobacterales bacterium]|nr:ribonuclease Y [Campylobacterales bacterium]